MTKWTSGPWWYSEEDNAVYESEANVIVVYENGLQFGRFDGHLIAAAPELYEALEQILLSCTDEDGLLKTSASEATGIDSAGEVVFKGSFLTFLTRAQAAMAKARGKQ